MSSLGATPFAWKRKGVFARLVCVSARMATRQSGDNEDEDDDDDDDDDEPVPKR